MGAKGKYHTIDLNQVERIAGLGLTDTEIGIAIGLSEATINNYKKKHPAFLESLKRGKLVADQLPSHPELETRWLWPVVLLRLSVNLSFPRPHKPVPL